MVTPRPRSNPAWSRGIEYVLHFDTVLLHPRWLTPELAALKPQPLGRLRHAFARLESRTRTEAFKRVERGSPISSDCLLHRREWHRRAEALMKLVFYAVFRVRRHRPGRPLSCTPCYGFGATSTLGGRGDGSGCIDRRMIENATAPPASAATPTAATTAHLRREWRGPQLPATAEADSRRPLGQRPVHAPPPPVPRCSSLATRLCR